MDDDGQPTNQILPKRRESKLLTPVPKPQKRRRTTNQPGFVFDSGHGLSTEEQEYNPTPIINEIRRYVEDWRNPRNPDQWQVNPRDRSAPPTLTAFGAERNSARQGAKMTVENGNRKLRRRNAALKAAETKGPEERKRAALMAAWTRKHGKNDAQNPHSKVSVEQKK